MINVEIAVFPLDNKERLVVGIDWASSVELCDIKSACLRARRG